MEKDRRQELPVGYKIGDYEIISCVGRGGSSLVYKVKKANKIYILKEIYPYRLALEGEVYRSLNDDIVVCSDEFQDDFEQYFQWQEKELETAGILRDSQGINDPYIFQIEKVNHNGSTALVIDTEGGDMLSEILKDRAQNGKVKGLINLKDVLVIIKSILEGLRQIHDKEYIHADISPDNLHVSALGHNDNVSERIIRTIDYNNTCLLKDVVKRKFSSKEKYSPLELKRENRKSQINFKSDLYSVGIIFLEILDSMFWDINKIDSLKSVYFIDETNEVIRETIKLVKTSLIDRIGSCDEFIASINNIINLIDNKFRLQSNFHDNEKFFTGREKELAQIKKEFDCDKNIVILRGTGGVGKSSIANEYAKINKNNYDKIVFIPYQGALFDTIINDNCVHITNFDFNLIHSDETEDFQKIKMRSLEKNETLNNKEKLENYYKIKLGKIKNLIDEKTLIIIDNMNNGEDERFNDLEKFNCDILITTRNEFVSHSSIEINVFDSITENLMIFAHYLSKEFSDEEIEKIEKIINQVGLLPLIVELVAKSIKASRLTIEEIYDAFTVQGFNYPSEKIKYDKDGVPLNKSVDEILKVIFDLSALSEEEKNVLRYMCLVSYEGIDTKEFKKACGFENYDVINRLVSTGYIQLNEQTDVISLHQVISDLCSKELKPNIDNCSKLIAFFTPPNEETLKELSYTIKSALRTRNLLMSNRLDSKSRIMVEFFKAMGDLLKNLSLIKESVEMYEKAYDLYDEFMFEEDEDLIFIITYNLAQNYLILGYYGDAIEIISDLLELCDEELVENDALIAILCNDLGLALSYAGQNEDALELYTEALNINIDLFSQKSIQVVVLYINIGLNYHLVGRYNQAIGEFSKALNIYLGLVDTKTQELALIYNNLALSYNAINQCDKAKELYDKALAIDLDLFGEKHKDVAMLYNNMGETYCSNEDYDNSILWYKKALYIRIEIFGEISKDVAISYNNIGYTTFLKGDLDEAVKFCKKALEINLEIYEDHNVDSALFLYNLGLIYSNMDALDKSIEVLRKSLEIRKELLEDNHIYLAYTYDALALCLYLNVNFEEAIDLFPKAIKIRTNLYGENSLDNAVNYNYLGLCYQEIGDYSTALEFYKKSLKIFHKILGLYDLNVATLHSNIADVYDLMENYGKSISYFKVALDIMLELPDVNNENIAIIYDKLADLYWSKGKNEKAKQMYLKALEYGLDD